MATFWCMVNPPDLTVRWRLDDFDLTNQGRISIRDDGALRILEISDSAKEDEGEVSVYAGEEMCTANLFVEGFYFDVEVVHARQHCCSLVHVLCMCY